ncbi:hypothetical protein GCM10022254_45060 [Actinomadura meridiana]|uniref:Uncharacterized protein n=1 Tax=Actinomadura meridiana TaxID=559626 RepID=A0ABP8C9K4_9ACTN
MRSVILVAGATAVTALSMAVSPVAAGAAPSPANSVPQAGQHCVVHLASGGGMSCYDTFTEAIDDATGGKITNAPRDAAGAVASAAFNRRVDAAAGRMADTVIEISYQHRDYQGATITWETSSGCDDSNDVEWEIGSISGSWNERISSFRTYASCQGKHYEHRDYGGASTPYWGSHKYIGDAMNDRTSSIRWN